jgi:pimeloyl-ACP methyl ester carboxylesterase
MKAREPARTGITERDGVRVAWQEYGELPGPDAPALLLLPTWSIVPAEVWKLQVPFLARRTRVVTFDPRGNGRSDSPTNPEAYRREELTRDALDVLDATGTRRAAVVALSAGNEQALDLAGDHPDRVAAWVAIAPSIRGLGGYSTERDAAFARWSQDTGDDHGWGRYNRHSWLRDYPGFVDFFFGEAVPEPHSTKLVEDLVRWSTGSSGEVLTATELARRPRPKSLAEQCAAVRCPVVVVHGTDDRVIPHAHAARLAELTGGDLVTFVGSGHLPQGRDPVAVNRLLDRVLGRARGRATGGAGEPPITPSGPTPSTRSRGAGG